MTDPTKKLPATRDSGREDDRTEKLRTSDRASFGRRVFWTLLVVGLVGALLIGVSAVNLVPWLKNPFKEQVTDRSQPPILLSIKDLARFVAAEGNFEVVIDLKRDRKFVPDWLLNERTLFVAAGTVEAYVDFSGLTEDKIKDSADHKTVEITLPPPQLGEPKLNLERSYVFAEERGLFNKIGDFFDGDVNRQRETLIVAEQRMSAAAKASTLTGRAQENTRKTLEGLLHSLGYTSVTIIFQDA